MAHLYEASIWQGSSGLWYVNDVKELAGVASKWWAPCRMLGLAPVDYVKILIDEFEVSKISFNEEKNFLYFAWKNESKARKYKNWINQMARKAKFIC